MKDAISELREKMRTFNEKLPGIMPFHNSAAAAFTDTSALDELTDSITRSSQEKLQREKALVGNSTRQIALIQSVLDVQHEQISLLKAQSELIELLVEEAKGNTPIAKLAVYFSALAAAIGLIALLK